MSDFVLPTAPQPFLATPSGKFPVHRIYCVGRNYYDHGIEMGGDPEREPPFFFMKPADSALTAREFDTVVPYPSSCSDLHYECEMVVAIGEGGKDIPVGEALKHVYGYCVGLDLTRRDLQKQAKAMRRPWDPSKGFDLSAPCGLLLPVGDRGHVRKGCVMECRLNGKVVQKTELSKMIWKVDEMIAQLSCLFQLQPGDLIMTGTPAGVGSLVPGDEVECLLTGLPPCRLTVGAVGSGLVQAERGARRVVTGHGDEGESCVLQDSKAPNTFCPPLQEGVQVNNIWRHLEAQPELGVGDVEACKFGEKIPALPSQDGGAIFRVIEFSPEGLWIDKVRRATSEWLGEEEEARHPLLQRHQTIDYGVVVSGQIFLMLDKEEVELKAGDTFVQRGTQHAWSNRSNLPCRIAFVIVDAKYDTDLKMKFASS